jgi:hypothetical protein
MKDVTFYAEYPSKKDKRNKTGNPTVVGISGPWYKSGPAYCKEGVGCISPDFRTQFTTGGYSDDYLKENCTRIGEKQARLMHPEIFNCGLL